MNDADDPLRTLSLVVMGFPVNVGSADRTTLPVPVDVVTPVPPRATGSVPDVIAAAVITLVASRVLFVRVCASVVPTTTPAGATFRVVTAPVPAPTRKLPEVNVATPVPPPATLILVMVFEAPEIVLLVRVSEVALPTRVSVDVGRVSVPVLTIVAITGAVRVLLVRVSVVILPTRVVVVVGRVSVPVLTIVAITGAVRVLLVSVSAVARPTSVSVDVGRVIVLAPLTTDKNAGVVRDGDVLNTSAPDPVSSLITPASCADVVDANWLSGFPVRAGADVDHDKLPSVSPNSTPLAIVLAVVGSTRL